MEINQCQNKSYIFISFPFVSLFLIRPTTMCTTSISTFPKQKKKKKKQVKATLINRQIPIYRRIKIFSQLYKLFQVELVINNKVEIARNSKEKEV